MVGRVVLALLSPVPCSGFDVLGSRVCPAVTPNFQQGSLEKNCCFERPIVVVRDLLLYGWYLCEVATTLANETSASTLSCRCLANSGPKRNSPACEGESWAYFPNDLSANSNKFVLLICDNISLAFPSRTNDRWIISSTSWTLIVASGSSSRSCSIRSDHMHVIGPQTFSITD